MLKRSVLLLLCTLTVLLAEERERKRGDFEISLGGVYSSVQDLAQSSNRYRGAGLVTNFGYTHELPRNNFIGAHLGIHVGALGSSTNDYSFLINGGLNADLEYLHRFDLTPTFSLDVGALALWQFRLRINDALQNNSISPIFENPLLLKVGMEKLLREKPLRFSTAVGLFGFVNKQTGYAFSVHQDIMEEGRFNYDDDPILTYGESQFRAIGSGYFRMKTELEYQFHSRWAVGYNWDLFYYDYKKDFGYPVTVADHTVKMTFLF